MEEERMDTCMGTKDDTYKWNVVEDEHRGRGFINAKRMSLDGWRLCSIRRGHWHFVNKDMEEEHTSKEREVEELATGTSRTFLSLMMDMRKIVGEYLSRIDKGLGTLQRLLVEQVRECFIVGTRPLIHIETEVGNTWNPNWRWKCVNGENFRTGGKNMWMNLWTPSI
jgi:hypothetical protein